MGIKVLFVSGRETDYIRNRVLLNALRSHFDVTILTSDHRGILLRTAGGLTNFLVKAPKYDVCFVGFYGQPLAIMLSILQDKPIIFDAYVSTYDTLCEDRQRFSPTSLPGQLSYWLDRRSCEVSAHILTDTQSNAHYFERVFSVPEAKLTPVYVGCDESIFYPRDDVQEEQGHFEVFYYGAFLPLHGTDIIVEAAALLKDRHDIHFTIGGDGMCSRVVNRIIAERSLENIDMVGWIPMEQLPQYISRASVCLGGHFSLIPKAARVISTKTFQFLAMRKPTIVGDNPATRELFTPGEDVYAVPMGDAKALAEAIQTLYDSAALRSKISIKGYELFQKQLSLQIIEKQLSDIIIELS